MRCYTWLVDKIVWLGLAVVGTILGWYVRAIVMEVIQ